MSRYSDSTSDQVSDYYAGKELKKEATKAEQERIINLLLDQNIIRRCGATGGLVAFTTDGTEVVYIKDLEWQAE